jgi:hypothetical protein
MIQIDEIKDLLQTADDQTLTLFVDVDPTKQGNIGDNPIWKIWVRNTLREMSQSLGEGETGVWATVRERAEAFLNGYQRNGKGLALLVSPNFERSYEFPFPLDNDASFGKPHVVPLLWAIDEYEPYVVTMVDHEKAFFIIAYLGAVAFEGSPLQIDFGAEHFGSKDIRVAPQTGEYVSRGSPRDEFQDFVEEHVARLHREVAEKAVELMKKHGARRLVLAGDETAAHAVAKHLPDQVAAQVVAIKAIPMRYTPKQILDEVQEDAIAFERQDEIKLVEQVIDFAKKGGRGALGWEAVRRALDMRQVELLILSWPLTDEAQATELALKTFASNGRIELVHGEAAQTLGGEGGLGARLYYAL